ncbi:MAG: hypothetical protein ACI8RZ_005434 [Myxococcota bacterium]|jgi:hypothetical protein
MNDDPGRHLTIHRAPPDLLERALAQQAPPVRQPRTFSWAVPMAIAAAFCLGVLLGRSDLPASTQPAEQTAALTPTRLVYHAEKATTVAVAGSWNGWEPEPMQATADGLFFTVVVLPPGRHEYMFVIDGEQWASDPTALLTHDDGFGQKNAVLQIGA